MTHWPASVKFSQFRGAFSGTRHFVEQRETAHVPFWQKSVILSCEGSSLCYSVAALEVCTVKNEKGKAEVTLVTYLLIVPPLPSCA